MEKPLFTPPKPLSKAERENSKNGLIGRFPSPDLYEFDENMVVEPSPTSSRIHDHLLFDMPQHRSGLLNLDSITSDNKAVCRFDMDADISAKDLPQHQLHTKSPLTQKNCAKSGFQPKHRQTEADTREWNSKYHNQQTPWRSQGINNITKDLLVKYSCFGKLLEIGCGCGDDAPELNELGFDYFGIDISDSAISQAEKMAHSECRFTTHDFFEWSPQAPFDVVYDKGVYHGLGGKNRRTKFSEKVALTLKPGGLWISICGAADTRREDFSHGSIYLSDYVSIVENSFEILNVQKSTYGLLDPSNDFTAWYIAARRR